MRLRFSRRKRTGQGQAHISPRFIAAELGRFAWIPKRLSSGTWIWLERYQIRQR